MYAAENDHYSIVEYLMEKGAKKDVQNGLGYTALMLAAEKGNKKIVDLLNAHLALVKANNGGLNMKRYKTKNRSRKPKTNKRKTRKCL
jgi:ankyrin repeat protein